MYLHPGRSATSAAYASLTGATRGDGRLGHRRATCGEPASARPVAGIAVAIGARVAALAAANEVMVSQTVRDLVAGSGITFADRGTHALKGVPGEWHLYTATSS